MTPAAIEQIKAVEARRIPIDRRGTPEEVATRVLRLADPDSTWLTGRCSPLTADWSWSNSSLDHARNTAPTSLTTPARPIAVRPPGDRLLPDTAEHRPADRQSRIRPTPVAPS